MTGTYDWNRQLQDSCGHYWHGALYFARSALVNSKLFEVSGLESPVVVMQSDDRNVVVYIPYRLKVGQ